MEDRGSRPETKPESSVVENILQIVCLAIISATIIYLAFSWGNLPQTVPTHFNFLGSPDELGDKATLLMYPIALLAIYVMITLVERFPKFLNYPFEITENNAQYMYRMAREMLIAIKTEIVILLSFIEWSMIQTAKGSITGLGFIALVAVGLIVLTILFYLLRMYKHKNTV